MSLLSLCVSVPRMSIYSLIIANNSGTVLYENFFDRSLTTQQKCDERRKLFTILKEENKESREKGKFVFFSYDADEKAALFSLQNDVIIVMTTRCTATESIMGGSSILLYDIMTRFIASVKAVCGIKDKEKDPAASLFTEAVIFKNYKEICAVVSSMFAPSGVAATASDGSTERCEGGLLVLSDPRLVDAAANFQIEKYKK